MVQVCIDPIERLDYVTLFESVQPLAKAYSIDRSDFEDLLQDTVVKLLVSSTAIVDVRAWFVRSVQNRCRSHARRSRRKRGREAELAGAEPASATDVSAACCARVDVARLFARLPVRQRELARRVELEGATAAAAGVALGYAPGSVKQTMARIRKRLAVMGAAPSAASGRAGSGSTRRTSRRPEGRGRASSGVEERGEPLDPVHQPWTGTAEAAVGVDRDEPAGARRAQGRPLRP